MTGVTVARLFIFPIKALDGVPVDSATVLPSGALLYDREFGLCDGEGRWFNGKRDGRVNAIRSEFDLDQGEVRLKSPTQTEWTSFHLSDDQPGLERWFSEEFQAPTFLKRNPVGGFPDDTYAPGPTVISAGTIAEVSSWFGLADQDETRRRLRTNIELSIETPFWEDRLFGKRGQDVAFQLGEAMLFGANPCMRCVVPTRDSRTGEPTVDFQKIFNARRAECLPSWSNRARFGPLFYRVAINTRVNGSEGGKRINVGDELNLVDGGTS